MSTINEFKGRMTAKDRSDMAWRLTASGMFSKSQIVKDAGVSNGTVGNLRKVYVLLGPEVSRKIKTWDKARAAAEALKVPHTEGDRE